MIHKQTLVNHSNGRVLFRAQKQRRRRPGINFDEHKINFAAGDCSVSVVNAHRNYFIHPCTTYFLCEVMWYVQANFHWFIFCTCLAILTAVRQIFNIIMDITVSVFEIVCLRLGGRGHFLFIPIVLYQQGVVPVSFPLGLLIMMVQTIFVKEDVIDFIASGKLNLAFHSSLNLSIFKHDFICCHMHSDTSMYTTASCTVDGGVGEEPVKRRNITLSGRRYHHASSWRSNIAVFR